MSKEREECVAAVLAAGFICALGGYVAGLLVAGWLLW